MKTYNPNLSVPEEISRKAAELKTWMEMFGAESIYGMGNVVDLQRQLADKQEELDDWIHANKIEVLQRQLAEVTAERGHFQRALHLADMLRNKTEGKDNGK